MTTIDKINEPVSAAYRILCFLESLNIESKEKDELIRFLEIQLQGEITPYEHGYMNGYDDCWDNFNVEE